MTRPPRARAAALLALALLAPAARAADAGPIEDNSFLVEEAYNQESRVVQHIFTWMRPRDGGAWEGSFTQEWPASGRRHQLSYTIPLVRVADAAGGGLGIGDIGLHYRFMALGVEGGRVAFAPRLSALLASGDVFRGLGAGAPGVQVNLPLSVTLAPRWVAHANAGATRIGDPRLISVGPSRPPTGNRGFNLSQSLIWLAAPRVNLMLELAWDRQEALFGSGSADREDGLLLAPGVRWAHDFANGLQIVPGVAVPIGLGPSRGERAIFLYASFEHGF